MTSTKEVVFTKKDARNCCYGGCSYSSCYIGNLRFCTTKQEMCDSIINKEDFNCSCMQNKIKQMKKLTSDSPFDF